jgi:hypothetical protein
LDNTSVDPELDSLRQTIVDIVKKEPYYGEKVPAKWILLEKPLAMQSDETRILPFEEIREISKTLKMDDAEIHLFLRYQHSKGELIFFGDEEQLREFVVLDPQFLIDAFKSLITCRDFCIRDPGLIEYWDDLYNNATLSDKLVDAVWGRQPMMHQHQEHLIKLMERLGIVARPREFTETGDVVATCDYHLMPSALRTVSPTFTESMAEDCVHPTAYLCYVFNEKFLPSNICHRLLAACIAKWPILKLDGKPQLFCGCGAFKIDPKNCVIVQFQEYVIRIKVTRLSTKEELPDPRLCESVREFIGNSLLRISNCHQQTIPYTEHVQCPEAPSHCTGLHSRSQLVEALQDGGELSCTDHGLHMVDCKTQLQAWYPEEVRMSGSDWMRGGERERERERGGGGGGRE